MQIEFSTAVNLLIAIALGVWAVAGTILGIWIKIGKLEKNLVSKSELKEHQKECPAMNYLRKEGKIFLFFFILLSLFFITGCSTTEKISGDIKENFKQKSVTMDGYFGFNKTTMMYDPTTGSFMPNFLQFVGRGTYISIVNGKNVTPVIAYYHTSDASIFNSNSKSTRSVLVIGSTDKQLLNKFLEIIATKVANEVAQNKAVQNE
ncbi:hypothetical protein AAEX28_13230 [Lentisphaerota bacterium WC36G]|nr:hypothetical protein LJT99_16060 [Lentisphaerae bacterium WC36]